MNINNSSCCIICLEEEDNSHVNSRDCEDKILPINNINELEKNCICKYNVHKRCIQDWVNNKPVCVLCNSPLYYIESNIHNSIPEGIIISYDNTNTNNTNNNTNTNNTNNNTNNIENVMITSYSSESDENEYATDNETQHYIYVSQPITSLRCCIITLFGCIVILMIINNTI